PRACSASATALITPALASMPIFTAPIWKSSKQASTWARRKSSGGTCTAVTPRVCWAVSAAMADRPCTPWAAKAVRSAWMPEQPLVSEPAMVREEGNEFNPKLCRRSAPWALLQEGAGDSQGGVEVVGEVQLARALVKLHVRQDP